MAKPDMKDRVPSSIYNEIFEAVKSVRKELYSEGLDTENVKEVQRIIKSASDFIFNDFKYDNSTYDKRMMAAFVLAFENDSNALKSLLNDLKGDKAELAKTVLVEIGDEVIEPLQKIASNQEHLGQESARDILPYVLARKAAKYIYEKHDVLLTPSENNLPEPCANRYNREVVNWSDIGFLTSSYVKYGFVFYNSPEVRKKRLRSILAIESEKSEEGLLVLSGVNPVNDHLLTYSFQYINTDFVPIKIKIDKYEDDLFPPNVLPLKVVYNKSSESYLFFFAQELPKPAIGCGYKMMNGKIRDNILTFDTSLNQYVVDFSGTPLASFENKNAMVTKISDKPNGIDQKQIESNVYYFDVVGVKNWDTLNIRSQPNYEADKVGQIPYNAKCVKYFGNSKMINKSKWAHIQYGPYKGWVNAKYLNESIKCN